MYINLYVELEAILIVAQNSCYMYKLLNVHEKIQYILDSQHCFFSNIESRNSMLKPSKAILELC